MATFVEQVTLVNLTPHEVNVWQNGEQRYTIPAEPVPARCAETLNQMPPFAVDGGEDVGVLTIPVDEIAYRDITGLPDPVSGVVYIVTRVVAERFAEIDPFRVDVVFPHRLVRNEAGDIVGCEAFGTME